MYLKKLDFNLLVISAIRYSIGRHTYIVSATGEIVRKHWKYIDKNTRIAIKRDITDYISSMEEWLWKEEDMDFSTWNELLLWMEENTPDEN